MKNVAFVANSHGYISHFIPLFEAMKDEIKPILFTVLKETAMYARDVLRIEAVYCLRDEHVWTEIKKRGIDNVILCYQKIGGDPRGLNTIQMFHGVSFKGPDLANWKPDRWEHIFVQGEHFWKPYTTRYAGQAHKMRRVTFSRAVYYKDVPPWDPTRPLVYAPTHRDAGLTNLRENIKLVAQSGLKVKVKLHPINMRNEYFMKTIHYLFRNNQDAELVTPDMPEYFYYDRLFYDSSCLISDFSSVVCEYTLMDRPIVILRGGPNGGRSITRGFRHLDEHLFHVGPDRDLVKAVHDAKQNFKPNGYPKLFVESECQDIVEAVREVLV